MHDFAVSNAMVQRLVVEEVEYVLDGTRQDVVSTGDAEQRLKQIVNIQLQRALDTTRRNRQISSILTAQWKLRAPVLS